ncbi:MAG: ABC transporter substrate-binding protein [Saprospiraceae bacterium]
MNRIGFIFFSLLVGLISCKTDKNQVDNTINIRIKKDPERLNPLLFPNPTAREIYQYIHLPLADFDPESLELSPILITEMPKEMDIDTGMYSGGIYFDITLLDNAKWDNGTPITSDDYIFTLKAINLPLTNAGKYREIVQNISEIIADPNNPKKFRVIFSKDYILALEAAVNIEIYPRYIYDSLNVLASYSFTDLTAKHEAALKEDSVLAGFADRFNSNDFSRNIISGSGPYKFVSWTSDQNIILEKKENYWGAGMTHASLRQGPDKMVFHIIPDELTAVTQLRAGAIDVINEISADSYNELLSDPTVRENFNFYHPSLIKHYYISINNQDPILSDKNIRKALALLIDVDNIIENLESGMGVRSTGPVHPVKKTFNKDLKPIEFNTEKAKEIITQAGWKDTDNDGIVDKILAGKKTKLDLEVLISGQELGKKLAIMLRESAKKVGINIRITEKDFKLIRAENLKTRKYQLVPAVLSQDIIAWDDLSKWLSENDTPDGSNDMSYRNPVTDELINKIIVTKDEAERIQLYKRIQEQIYNDQPAIFLYAPEEKIIISKKWNSSSTVKRPGYMANTFSKSGWKVINNN